MRNRQDEFVSTRLFDTASNRGGRRLNSPSPAESSRRFGWFGVAVLHGAVFCFVSVLLGVSVNAQTSQGISGVVSDSSGAVIPNAKVVVHNQATGIDTTVFTTATGNYSVPFLHPGVYDVHAEAENFKPVDKTQITIQTDQTVEVDFALSPGSVYYVHKDPDGHHGGGVLADNSDGFQNYENGGATGCFAFFTLAALYDLGRAAEADEILFAMLGEYDRGGFEGREAKGRSNDWRRWDGTPMGYEGFLTDNHYTLMAVPLRQSETRWVEGFRPQTDLT